MPQSPAFGPAQIRELTDGFFEAALEVRKRIHLILNCSSSKLSPDARFVEEGFRTRQQG